MKQKIEKIDNDKYRIKTLRLAKAEDGSSVYVEQDESYDQVVNKTSIQAEINKLQSILDSLNAHDTKDA